MFFDNSSDHRRGRKVRRDTTPLPPFLRGIFKVPLNKGGLRGLLCVLSGELLQNYGIRFNS